MVVRIIDLEKQKNILSDTVSIDIDLLLTLSKDDIVIFKNKHYETCSAKYENKIIDTVNKTITIFASLIKED